MTDLLIRNIEPQLKRQIEESARRNKHSLSQEAKDLLRRGLPSTDHPKNLGTWLFNLVPDEYRGDDLVFERHDPARPPPDLG
jgi:plasmid stability protein